MSIPTTHIAARDFGQVTEIRTYSEELVLQGRSRKVRTSTKRVYDCSCWFAHRYVMALAIVAAAASICLALRG